MEDTKQKVMSNFIWRFAERCGAQIVAFIVSVVLARILEPEYYGTVALITVITSILQVFVDSGLGNALIQKKDADDMDFSTVFFTNIFFCVFLYIVLFASYPLIAKFYNNVVLVPYIRVLGITILVSGVKNVQQAYVSKKLIFKKFFWATLVGTLIAAGIGIIMALNDFGVWAIIAQQIVNVSIDTLMLWITVNWRPKLVFSFRRLKELFSYGWKLLISSLMSTIYGDIRQLVIGKRYSSSDLAYYNRASQFPNLIVTNVNTSIDSVLLPTMSQHQDDKEKVKTMTRRAIKISVFIMSPLLMGLAFCSNNVISIILTDKWLPCVPFMVILCVTFMFQPIHTANLNAIKAMGRSDLFLKLEIVKKVVGISLLLITMNISVMAMAYSLLVSSVFDQIINSWPNKKLLNYSYLQQLKDIAPSILLAVGMGAIVYCWNFAGLGTVVTLILQVLTGVVVYIAGAKLFKNDSFEYVLETVKGLVKRKKKVEEK